MVMSRGLIFVLVGALFVPQTGWGREESSAVEVPVSSEEPSSGESPSGDALVAGARSFVQKMGESALGVLMDRQTASAERFATFKKILQADFDIQGIGRYLIGEDTFQGLTSSEQAGYEGLLPDYIVKIYLGKFEEYNKEGFSKDTFKVGRAFRRDATDPQSAISVNSTIKLPGGSGLLKVDWRVFDTPNGLKILDVYVDDLSMSQTKRDEFRSLLNTGGFAELIKRLREQVGTAH